MGKLHTKHFPALPRKTISVQMGVIEELDKLRDTGVYCRHNLSYNTVIRSLLYASDNSKRAFLVKDWVDTNSPRALEELMVELDRRWRETIGIKGYKHPLSRR